MGHTSPLLSFRRLTTSNPPFSSHQILSLIQSCKSTKQIKQIHAHIIQTDQITNTLIASKTLEFYAISTRNIGHALRVFNNINHPDAHTWTAVIRGFVGNKTPNKAIEFYITMRAQNVKPNKFTFLFVLKAFSLISCYKKGEVVHGEVLKLGLYTDTYLRNALMHLYSKCGDIRGAYTLFLELETDNVVNWNTMIGGCFACYDIERATKLFDEMPERNVETWNVMISGYSKLGLVDNARRVFDEMPERDLFSWGAMISGYVHSRKAAKALELFEEMQKNGVRRDSVILCSALSACAQSGALDMGRWIHTYTQKNKFKHDVFLGTALVDMYSKCGCVDIALQVFNGMPHKNVCSWNAVICGLAIHGYGADVLDLYRQMELERVQPNDITFVGVLCACNHIGSVEEGRRYFNRMSKEFGIVPKIEHYGCMVDILGKTGLIEEAKTVIKSMPMEPNIVVWGALLSACMVHGYTNVGEDVVRHLQKLAPGDGGCYVLLSNIYAVENRWDEVAKLRKVMRDLGVEKKTPGCSSIEVNSVVHEFLVEDKFHPKWIEVYDRIERLTFHLEVEGYVPNLSLLLYNINE